MVSQIEQGHPWVDPSARGSAPPHPRCIQYIRREPPELTLFGQVYTPGSGGVLDRASWDRGGSWAWPWTWLEHPTTCLQPQILHRWSLPVLLRQRTGPLYIQEGSWVPTLGHPLDGLPPLYHGGSVHTLFIWVFIGGSGHVRWYRGAGLARGSSWTCHPGMVMLAWLHRYPRW